MIINGVCCNRNPTVRFELFKDLVRVDVSNKQRHEEPITVFCVTL